MNDDLILAIGRAAINARDARAIADDLSAAGHTSSIQHRLAYLKLERAENERDTLIQAYREERVRTVPKDR